MAKKNLDKVFSDALRKHQTPAPKGAWERLEQGLEGKEKRKKRRRVWVWLLLLTAGASGVSYGAWKYQQPSVAIAKVQRSQMPLPLHELQIQKEVEPTTDASTQSNIFQQAKHEQSNNRPKQDNSSKVQPSQKPINTIPQKIHHKQIIPTIKAPQRLAIPPRVVDRISIPPMAVKPPKKSYNIRVEITIPYRGKESKATSEPQKKKVNWRKVMKHIIDD